MHQSLPITILLGSILPPTAPAEIRIASGASLGINGTVTTNTIHLQNGSTLSGNGQVTGEIIADSGGTLSPGGSPGTLTTIGATTLAGTFHCEVDNPNSDSLVVEGALDISGATLQLDDLSIGELLPGYTIAKYDTLNGSSFAQVLNLPPGYVIDYNFYDGRDSNNIALIHKTVPYIYWTHTVGLTPGVNDGINDDPNQDGIPNLIHFAHDTNPLGNGGDEGKRQIEVVQIADENYLCVTFPVRIGAVFSGTPSPFATIDGIRLGVRGADQLGPVWDLSLVEYFPSLDTDLPPLRDSDGDGSADWEYRTFRLSDPMSLHSNSFLQLSIEQAP